MTRDELLLAVGEIRDEFIREAAPPAASYRKRREFPWAAAAAACLALLLVSSALFLPWSGGGDMSASTSGEAAGGAAVSESGADGDAGAAPEETPAAGEEPAEDTVPEAPLPAWGPVRVDGRIYTADQGQTPLAECPEGFALAGEVTLETGEICGYYRAPETPDEIYVNQSCRVGGQEILGFVRYTAR